MNQNDFVFFLVAGIIGSSVLVIPERFRGVTSGVAWLIVVVWAVLKLLGVARA